MTGKEPVLEWLPPGWKVGVKVRRNGVKDRTYFHPTNVLKFCSKNKLLRYINTPEKSTEKATQKSDLTELYFIETSTGYKFNSMTTVRNYLNAKHKEMPSMECSLEKPASDPRGRRLRQIRPKQSLLKEQILNSNMSVKVNEVTSNNNPDDSANLDKDANNEVNKNTNDSEVQLTHLKDGSPVEWKRIKHLVSKIKRKQDCHPHESKVHKAFQLVPRRSGQLAALKDVLKSETEFEITRTIFYLIIMNRIHPLWLLLIRASILDFKVVEENTCTTSVYKTSGEMVK